MGQEIADQLFAMSNETVVPQSPIHLDDVEIRVLNLPEGPLLYKRTSIGDILPGFVPPRGSRLQPSTVKIGYLTGEEIGHRGPRDGGFFAILVRTKGFPDIETVDRMMKAAIWRFRAYKCNEYYNTECYRDGLHLWDHEDPYMHLLQPQTRYLEEAFIAKTTVEDLVEQRSTQTSRAGYRITIAYERMPNWDEYLQQPIVIRRPRVEIARAYQKRAEAEAALAAAEQKSIEAEAELAKLRLQTAEAEVELAKLRLQTGEARRRAAEFEYKVARELRRNAFVNRQTKALELSDEIIRNRDLAFELFRGGHISERELVARCNVYQRNFDSLVLIDIANGDWPEPEYDRPGRVRRASV